MSPYSSFKPFIIASFLEPPPQINKHFGLLEKKFRLSLSCKLINLDNVAALSSGGKCSMHD